jgi:hypothetical protein
MKTYLINESKEERKRRKALEKQSLSPIIENSVNKKYVTCLKWGNKYGPEYVNNLYKMTQRNLTVDHEFICFTENKQGIDTAIRTEPLPNLPVIGWWYKVWFLSNELPIKGTLLFLDLDLIVFRNIDNLFNYKPEKKFCIIRDFNRHIRSTWDRMNSSVFRTSIGHYDSQYQNFKKNAQSISRNTQGDQDWMYKNIKEFEFWPDEWIQSYKWEMRKKQDLGIVNGKRNFKTPGIPNILDNTSIAVFHGDPNIHECTDQWPRENWG